MELSHLLRLDGNLQLTRPFRARRLHGEAEFLSPSGPLLGLSSAPVTEPRLGLVSATLIQSPASVFINKAGKNNLTVTHFLTLTSLFTAPMILLNDSFSSLIYNISSGKFRAFFLMDYVFSPH